MTVRCEHPGVDEHVGCGVCLQEAAAKLARQRRRAVIVARAALVLLAGTVIGVTFWWTRPHVLTFDEARQLENAPIYQFPGGIRCLAAACVKCDGDGCQTFVPPPR